MKKVVEGGSQHGQVWLFWCPGCKEVHSVDNRWTFNGDVESPTFSPSLLVYEVPGGYRCHSFITDGEIDFLGDCSHDFVNRKVPVPEWPYGRGKFGGVKEDPEPEIDDEEAL